MRSAGSLTSIRPGTSQAQAATETTAGKMHNLKRDLGEASEEMGTKLLPAMTGFASFATDKLIPALDQLTGGNGAFALLGVAVAGPILSNIVKLKTSIEALNLSLDATAVKAAGALGALGIIVGGGTDLARDLGEGGGWRGILNSVLGGGGEKGIFGKNNLGLRAAGGPVSAGGAYVVGERGPEMFVPGRSGTILPNGAGGTVINVTVNGSLVHESGLADLVHGALLQKQRRTPLGLH